MLCTRCQTNSASIHFETVINGQKTSANLCTACAKSAGLMMAGEVSINFPSLSPSLSALMGVLSRWSPPATASPPCPRCRWTLARFRQTGKMGCPQCYVHFHAAAQKILGQIHGSISHKGRKPDAASPVPAKSKGGDKSSTRDLRHRLEKAIKEERFEDAAELRDEIRSLESAT